MATIDLDLVQKLENSSCLNEKAQVGGRGLEEVRIDTWLSPVIEQSHDPSPSLPKHNLRQSCAPGVYKKLSLVTTLSQIVFGWV